MRIACTHGLLRGGALARIAAAPEVTGIVCTSTVPPPQTGQAKLTVDSRGPGR